jgi:hypothetical protein
MTLENWSINDVGWLWGRNSEGYRIGIPAQNIQHIVVVEEKNEQ